MTYNDIMFKIMPVRFWIASALLVAIIGATMTMPNPLQQSLPGVITNQDESPLISRIGEVVDVVESDNITVKISGSGVLVTASYLFPQYEPLLGDRVYVTKQDSQWFVLGTMSGPINTAITNASFEQGGVGNIPTGWSLTVISTGGGTPTFTVVSNGSDGISGNFEADFGVDSTVAGTSAADAFSPTAQAAEGQKWTTAFWVANTFIDNDTVTFAGSGGFSSLEVFVQFRNGTTLISEDSMIFFGMNFDLPVRTYRRADPPQYTIAPAGTDNVRLRIRGTFTMSATAFTSWFIDYMILRQVS